MTHVLSVTAPAVSESFSLVATNCRLMRYAPEQASMADYETDKPITETIELWLYGATLSAVQSAKSSLQRLIWRASERKRKQAGPRVYLEWTPMNEATAYRSEILDGALLPEDTILQAWGNNIIPAKLVIERVPYREGAETEIALTSSTQSTAATGGRTITVGTVPWVGIASTAVTGDVPSPVRLEITNTSGASLSPRNLYFGVNANHNVSLTGFIGTSAGGAATLTNVWSNLESFGINSAVIEQMAGRRFRIFAVATAVPTTSQWLRAVIRSNSTEIWQPSVAVQGGVSALIDLGTAPMPPGGEAAANAALEVTLQGFGAGSINFDSIFVIPTDSYSRVTQSGGAIANNQAMSIDWMLNSAWLDISLERYLLFGSLTGKLTVFPGRSQRIFTLLDTSAGAFPSTATLSIRAYYRPRRLAV